MDSKVKSLRKQLIPNSYGVIDTNNKGIKNYLENKMIGLDYFIVRQFQ